MTAISITELCKVYRVWPHPSEMLKEIVTGRRRHSQFQALTDISMQVPRGSITGIMGRNGAGKSTLLRIVAGTLDATSGTVAVNGRIAAILELGSGFHPDYTGRENVVLGGMCIGLTRQEIGARFDEIVDFAELREFMDQPFRTYSSGMQARLTFAVATSVDADIIIIDEALSVGDARFQLKSFDRIRDFKRRGRTILLVSHDINAISAMCDHAVLLEHGRVHAAGAPARVGNIYHELLFGPRDAAVSALDQEPVGVHFAVEEGGAGGEGDRPIMRAVDEPCRRFSEQPAVIPDEDQLLPNATSLVTGRGDAEHRYGLRTVRIEGFQVTKAGQPVSALWSLETYSIEFTIQAHKSTGPLHFGFLLRTSRGMTVCGWDTGTAELAPLNPFAPGEVRVVGVDMRANLAPGRYFLTAALARPDRTKEDVRFDALELTVQGGGILHTDSIVDLEIRCPSVGLGTQPVLQREEG